jgi:hypothetical protein
MVGRSRASLFRRTLGGKAVRVGKHSGWRRAVLASILVAGHRRRAERLARQFKLGQFVPLRCQHPSTRCFPRPANPPKFADRAPYHDAPRGRVVGRVGASPGSLVVCPPRPFRSGRLGSQWGGQGPLDRVLSNGTERSKNKI